MVCWLFARAWLLPIHPLSILFCVATPLFELLVPRLGGLGDPLALLANLGPRPGVQDHLAELVGGRLSVHSLRPVFLCRDRQYALLGNLVGLLLLEAALDFGRHPRLSGLQIQAELDLGAQFVDVLSARARGPNKINLHPVFRYAEVFGDRPVRNILLVVVGLLGGLRFRVVGNVFPRRYNLVLVVLV